MRCSCTPISYWSRNQLIIQTSYDRYFQVRFFVCFQSYFIHNYATLSLQMHLGEPVLKIEVLSYISSISVALCNHPASTDIRVELMLYEPCYLFIS